MAESTHSYLLFRRSLTSVSISEDKKAGDAAGNNAAQTPQVAHFDPFAPANLAGKMLYDHDLDAFEDKPWRKPGADLTDYFNYGFTESNWRAYCMKQRALRDEFASQKKISVTEGPRAPHNESSRHHHHTDRYNNDYRDRNDRNDRSDRNDRYDHREQRSSRHGRSPSPPPPPRRVIRHDDEASPSSSMKRRRD